MPADKTLFNDSFSIRDSAQQKRKKARAQVQLPAEITLDGGSGPYAATLTDLGTGGLSLQCKTTLYGGDSVQVQFRLKDRLMQLNGSVARSSGKSIGIQFSAITEEELDIIQSFIHTAFFEKEKERAR